MAQQHSSTGPEIILLGPAQEAQMAEIKTCMRHTFFLFPSYIFFKMKRNVSVSTCKALQAYNQRLTPTLTAYRL
jgi:hypothetical protein